MTTTEPAEGQETPAPTCYRHPKRETYVRCTRCDRYMCPDCMRDAAVGHQCVECVRAGNKTVRRARTVFGGRPAVRPVITMTLIGINVVAYLGELVRPGIVAEFDSLGIGLVRADGNYFVYDSGGSLPGYQLAGIAHGEWYRLVTSTFLHLLPTQGVFGIAHIVFNMWWLWRLGPAVEEVLGRLRFLVLYLLSGLGGGVLLYLIEPTASAVGASGAIFGLAGAYYVTSRRLNRLSGDARQVMVLFLVWMVVSAAITSWEGHLGGLLAGSAVAVAYAYAPRQQRVIVHVVASVGMLTLLVMLVALKTSQLTAVA
jgi:membrane associated rhomboid family serine protease